MAESASRGDWAWGRVSRSRSISRPPSRRRSSRDLRALHSGSLRPRRGCIYSRRSRPRPWSSATASWFRAFAVWKLRHALDWRRLSPFLVGGALGVPIGVFVLRWADPASMRVAVGVLLIAYSVYAFLRPEVKPARAAGALTDGSIGILNGVLGGMTGLAGIVVTVWCGVRGWPKDVQRAVFQPVAVAVFAMSAAWLGASRTISPDAIKLFVIGLPPLLLGTWAGLKLYGHLDETQFRRLILVLLLVSGAASMLQR